MAKLTLLTGLVLLLNAQIDCVPSAHPNLPTTTTPTITVPLCTSHTTESVTGSSGSNPGGSGGSSFCASKANGTYAHPTSKSSFYNCVNGETFLESCQNGLVFDTSCSCCNRP